MLISLQVNNFVLMDNLRFEPGKGLNTITGETGAGKSILIGALGLILGERADIKSIGNSGNKCVIEGTFDISNLGLQNFFDDNDLDFLPTTILRREILDSGRSRAFVNDTPVSLNALKDLGEKLVDIHSQHQTSRISDSDFLFEWLEGVCKTQIDFEEYSKNFRSLRDAQKQLATLREKERQQLAQADYNNFLWEELSKAELKTGEMKSLEEEYELLQNAGDIETGIAAICNIFTESDEPALDVLKSTVRQLLKLAPADSSLGELSKRLEGISIDLDDALSELKKVGESLPSDSSRLDDVNSRLQFLQQLMHKHNVQEADDLITVRDRLSDLMYENDELTNEIKKLENASQVLEQKAVKSALDLHKKRVEAAAKVEEEMNSELWKLGLPNARVKLDLEQNEQLTSHGLTVFRILFTSNKGQDLRPVQLVASGGELSRLMLVMKAQMAKSRRMPSIIFDEIDTGVSGEIGKRMAEVMADLSKDLQVISITHLPQIAARGEDHFFVYKETGSTSTVTRIKSITGSDRVVEIAKMLSGDDPSEGAMANARELLKY
ncbi:MAG: DNA repair protein RecN [Bacteroidetes bacterium]|nr:DNA repair protein RecN [Bacteroidota bacterium]